MLSQGNSTGREVGRWTKKLYFALGAIATEETAATMWMVIMS
jgi:hypothetical protein